jgi:hypothetical protein
LKNIDNCLINQRLIEKAPQNFILVNYVMDLLKNSRTPSDQRERLYGSRPGPATSSERLYNSRIIRVKKRKDGRAKPSFPGGERNEINISLLPLNANYVPTNPKKTIYIITLKLIDFATS